MYYSFPSARLIGCLKFLGVLDSFDSSPKLGRNIISTFIHDNLQISKFIYSYSFDAFWYHLKDVFKGFSMPKKVCILELPIKSYEFLNFLKLFFSTIKVGNPVCDLSR